MTAPTDSAPEMSAPEMSAPEMAGEMLAEADAATVTPQHIRDVFVKYGAAHSAGDIDAIMALFAPDAVIRDPANSPEQRGHAALRAFFVAGAESSGGRIEMTLEGAVRIAGNQGAAAYIVRTVSSQPVYRVETLDVMTFGPDGLITEMVAYWGPENFSVETPGA